MGEKRKGMTGVEQEGKRLNERRRRHRFVVSSLYSLFLVPLLFGVCVCVCAPTGGKKNGNGSKTGKEKQRRDGVGGGGG